MKHLNFTHFLQAYVSLRNWCLRDRYWAMYLSGTNFYCRRFVLSSFQITCIFALNNWENKQRIEELKPFLGFHLLVFLWNWNKNKNSQNNMVSNQLFQEKHPAQRVENSLNSMERNIKL